MALSKVVKSIEKDYIWNISQDGRVIVGGYKYCFIYLHMTV